MIRFLRRFWKDVRSGFEHFKLLRFFRNATPLLVTTHIENFDKPNMCIPSMVVKLIKKYKLDPLTLDNYDGSGTACIGFSPKTQKWYGWSHRAIYGFAIGDSVEEGDVTTTTGFTEEYEKAFPIKAFKHVLSVGFKAETLDDAKRMAIAFAASVS